jgi:RNA polymerase sigma factor (sigma-70 family)
LGVNNLNINSDDIDIISSFKEGNESAFNYLVLKYQKKIYWVVRKMVIDHDEADEITQEVFIKLFKSLKDFRGESALYTYIYKIAINYSLNYLKKQKSIFSKTKIFSEEEYKISSGENQQDELIDESARKQLLKEAINMLPNQQRAVFNMRFYDNLSYDEIANILNKSVGGMKANYFHAVKKIGNIIKRKRFNINNL